MATKNKKHFVDCRGVPIEVGDIVVVMYPCGTMAPILLCAEVVRMTNKMVVVDRRPEFDNMSVSSEASGRVDRGYYTRDGKKVMPNKCVVLIEHSLLTQETPKETASLRWLEKTVPKPIDELRMRKEMADRLTREITQEKETLEKERTLAQASHKTYEYQRALIGQLEKDRMR